jgi:hypothetical protein
MKKEKGYIAVLTVLIISAVVLTAATTVSLLAIGEAQSSLSLFKGEDAITFVEGCMEDALLKARNNNAYTSGTITRPEGTCTITVSKAGSTWTVTATTINTQYARTVQAVVTRSSFLTITSWKEI